MTVRALPGFRVMEMGCVDDGEEGCVMGERKEGKARVLRIWAGALGMRRGVVVPSSSKLNPATMRDETQGRSFLQIGRGRKAGNKEGNMNLNCSSLVGYSNQLAES